MFCYFSLRCGVFLAVGASLWKGVVVQMKTGIEKWRELDGDNTLALDWDLNEDSHVWEIGGFEGRWAQQIWDKFHCHITIFEPQLWAVEKMQKRFDGIEKIEIRPYGLWVVEEKTKMGRRFTDGATIIGSQGSKDYYDADNPLFDFKVFISEVDNFNNNIDLALMNIEGAEWQLIQETLRYSNRVERFNLFWCQFHLGGWDEESLKAMKNGIYDGMKKSHNLLWDCYPTAVAWKRK